MAACFECGREAEHDHHVVPEVRGGTKTVPLCGECHGKAHHRNHRMASSELTKEGLAIAKRRGVKLGSARPGHWDGREDRRQAGQAKAVEAAAESRRKIADEAYKDLYPLVVVWRKQGKRFREIVDELNLQGKTTIRGHPWNPTQVLRVLRRARKLGYGTPPRQKQMELFQ